MWWQFFYFLFSATDEKYFRKANQRETFLLSFFTKATSGPIFIKRVAQNLFSSAYVALSNWKKKNFKNNTKKEKEEDISLFLYLIPSLAFTCILPCFKF